MDITKTAVSDTAPIHLKDASGNFLYSDGDTAKPVRIHVYGPGSKAFAALEARQSQRVLKRMQDNDGKPAIPSPEDRARETAEDLASITVKFENFSYPPAEGKEGAELFAAVYLDRSIGFIAKQVAKFVDDWGNFKPGSAIN